MADITPVPEWGPVPVLDTSDLAEGGEGGRANAQAQALTNLIYWLLARGAGTTYDSDVPYLPGALTVKDGRLQIFDGAAWKNIGQDDAALKKASNLSDVPDKAEARENLDVYDKAKVDQLNGTIPLGVVWFWTGNRSAIPDSCAPYDGDVVNRADFPDLWADIAAGKYPTVSDAVWLASGAHRFKFSTGNGSTTFRFPDYNGVKAGSFKSPVLRGDGYAPIGGVLGDAMRDHNHVLMTGRSDAATYHAPGSLRGHVGAGFTPTYDEGPEWVRGVADSPVADENRPNSGFGVWIGKVRGGTRSTPAEGGPATLLANEYLGAQKINGPLVVTGSYTGDLLPNVKAALNAEGTASLQGTLRHWVYFTVSGTTITIVESKNVASVVRLGASNYKITYSSPPENTKYLVTTSGSAQVSSTNQYAMTPATRNLRSDSIEIYHPNPSGEFPSVMLGVFY